MRFYQYKAKDIRGYSCSGSLKAESEEAARRQLEARRLTSIEIEEDHEAFSRVSEATRRMPPVRPKKESSIQNFLSYAMPAGAALLAICGIPIVMSLVRPAAPSETPVKVLEAYFHLESSGQFEKQYALLSSARKNSFKNVNDYIDKRKQSLSPSGLSGPVIPGKFSGAKQIEKKQRRVRYEVKILRPSGVDTGEAVLTLSRGKWGVDSLRDPGIVNAYLDRLLESSSETAKHPVLIALKRETGYSDLDIEKLLKDRKSEKKKQEIGGDTFLL